MTTPAPPRFVFTVCQPGFEATLKQEVARLRPDWRFAFSRPGFVTFRAGDRDAAPGLRAVFARTTGLSLGKVRDADTDALARAFWQAEGAGDDFAALHVWPRERDLPGDPDPRPERGGEAEAAAAVEAIVRHAPRRMAKVNAPAARGERVLDCVLVEPNEWWIGAHRATTPDTCWPGGVPPIEPPAGMISRAYLKLVEALLWSELPVAAGDRCVEIGSAPGGSCQALLERGCAVIGVDPAEMDAAVLADPRFTHVRERVKDVDRAVFRGCRWLTADVNLPPAYTLDTVEAIVTAPAVDVEGLVLTLKLTDPRKAAEVPTYVQRIKRWGYARVRARQLAFNRQEVCVVAQRS
jgi:23S rRNA (cytidine2498-2'-O)-methyltransferase